jgi:transposase
MEHKREKSKKKVPRSLLKTINPNVAGIDCGSAEHYVAVPRERDPTPVRSFKTFTHDLYRLADWLSSCGVTSVAMESTGVYWIPIYEILEARGFEVVLANARHVKNVPGRKSDVSDCEWLRELHSVGLLRGSFRPLAAITTLRSYLRHRETLVQSAATHIQRMQKALVQMNVQLHLVVSDITGVTGLKILRDIVAGRTNPRLLAQHRDHRCRASEADIAAALTGNYLPEHLFALRQNLELFDAIQLQIETCDSAVEAQLTLMTRGTEASLPPQRNMRKPRDNEPRFEIRPLLYQVTGGVDLSQIDGIRPYTALRLISEIGTDMNRWPTEKHFTSWLTLAPQNKVSGGRLLSSRTQPSANRAAAILRMAAMSLSRTQTALGAYFRRLAYRVGKAKAVTATARKLAILVYRTLKHGLVYKDPGAAAYNAQDHQRQIRRLTQRAADLGFALLDTNSGEVLSAPVS